MVAVSIALGPSPRQRGRLERTVEALWSIGAQLKSFTIDLYQPHLPSSEPIREEAYGHFMGQRLLVLVDEEAIRISDVRASRSGVLLWSSAEKIAIGKRKSLATLQLRRHVSVGGIQYEPERTVAQWMILNGSFDVAFDTTS
jgi:hypothetical protein